MPAGRQLQRPGPNLGQIAIGDVKHLQVLVDIVGDIQVVAVQAVGGSPRHAAQRRSTSPLLERCFDDGRLALNNNLAAPALRCVAIGRQNDLLAGSDTGGHREWARPQLYLTDLLVRTGDQPARRIAELLPWNWQPADPRPCPRLTGAFIERLRRRGWPRWCEKAPLFGDRFDGSS